MPCHQEDTSNPFFSYDPEKCIMCRRCARVCQLRQEEMYLVLLIVALKQK